MKPLKHRFAAASISTVLLVVFLLGGCLNCVAMMQPLEESSSHHCCKPDSGCKAPPKQTEEHERDCGGAAVDFSKIEASPSLQYHPAVLAAGIDPMAAVQPHVSARALTGYELIPAADPLRLTSVLRI